MNLNPYRDPRGLGNRGNSDNAPRYKRERDEARARATAAEEAIARVRDELDRLADEPITTPRAALLRIRAALDEPQEPTP